MTNKHRPQSSGSRGRPREFDTEQTLARIAEVFWQHGYSGTSLEDIGGATELTRPSLYAAYGDKRSMYLRALDHFAKRMRQVLVAALSGNEDLVQDLKNAYSGAIDVYTSGTASGRGCLAICTASTESAADPIIRRALAVVLAGMDRAFAERIRRAQRAEKCPPRGDATLLAGIAAATLHSLALRARVGVPARELRRLADKAASVICANSEE